MPPFIAVRVAFASDPLDDTPTWTDITPYVKAISTDTGRQQETDEFQAARLSVTLDNHDRRFDPLHTGSPYSPNLKPRKRITVGAGGYLNLPGVDNARATCPDAAGLDITGDIDLRAAIRMTDWTPVADFNVAAVLGKWDPGGAYNFFVLNTGELGLQWRDSGGVDRTAISTVATGFTDGTTHWIRVTLDVDNGAAGRDIKFYTSNQGPAVFVPTWIQLGATVTQAGVTSIQSNASTGFVGAIGAVEEWAGRFFRGEIRNGINGTIVASPNFMVTDSAPFADAQGNVWSIQGTAGLVADPDLFHISTDLVDGWPQTTYRPPGDAETTITASDMFVLLANIDLPRSVYAIEVEADNPTVWYGLGEDEGNEAQDLSGNARKGVYQQSATDRKAPALIFGDQDGAAKQPTVLVPNYGEGTLVATQDIPSLAYPMTFEMWLHVVEPSDLFGAHADNYGYGHAGGKSSLSVTTADLQADGVQYFFDTTLDDPGGGWHTFTTTTTVKLAPRPHHLVTILRDPAGGAPHIETFVDGVALALTEASRPATTSSATYLTVGSRDKDLAQTGIEVTRDEFAVYPSALSTARIQMHHDAGSTPWDGDTTGGRINRILDLVGIGALDRDIDTGLTTLGPATLATDALSYCKSIARTEDGDFYVAHQEGKLRFRDRQQQFTDPRSKVSQVSFSDDPNDATAVRVEPEDIQIWIDEQLLVNEATVTWDAGSNTASDSTSQTAFGRRAQTFDTKLKSSNEAQNLAEWKVFRRKNPITRINSLTIRPTDQQSWQAALGLRIGDRVTFRFHPQQVGTAINLPFRVEGIDHRIGDGINEWTTTFDLSPVDAVADNVWIWDVSEWEEVDPNPTTRWAY